MTDIHDEYVKIEFHNREGVFVCRLLWISARENPWIVDYFDADEAIPFTVEDYINAGEKYLNLSVSDDLFDAPKEKAEEGAAANG